MTPRKCLSSMKREFPITDELDFHYLLCLMPPLHGMPEYAWLPELFSTVGHKSLLKLCKFAGGETIRIPTLEELSHAIEALQYFYDVYISNKRSSSEIPLEYIRTVNDIRKVYNAGLNKARDK